MYSVSSCYFRLHGKNTLVMLSQDPDFERVLAKTVNANQQNTIKNIVGAVKFKVASNITADYVQDLHKFVLIYSLPKQHQILLRLLRNLLVS